MGLNFRKSIRVGKYFKINLSKSGIGYSVGTKGARVTVSPKGRTTATVSIPGTGISHTQTIGSSKKCSPSSNNSHPVTPENDAENGIAVESACIASFKPADKKEIFKGIELCKTVNVLGISLAILGFVFSAQLTRGEILLGVLGILGLIVGIAGIIAARFVLPINLDYSVDADLLDKHEQLLSAWNQMCSSIMKWQITSYVDVTQKRNNAGADKNITRAPFQASKTLPYYIKTNAPHLTIKLKNEELILLPDQILIIKNSSVGSISYADIKCEVGTSNFVETIGVCKDAEVVGETWEYVNKDGSPDKRHSENRKLSICKYGEIKITSSNGLNVWLQCSDWRKISQLEELYG